MKLISIIFAVTAIFISTAANAGPTVTVTFNNQATTDATYTIITVNESNTYLYSSPKPDSTVLAGNSDIYAVTNPLGPYVGYAVARYKMGSKECVFSTTFVYMLQPGGYYSPQWNKGATPSGGAICTATITSTNFSTYAWTVNFTMK